MAGGDWTPTELSSQTVGWYKADIITGKNDGDEVDSWTDSSGESNTLTQTASGADPVFKTDILNGLPVLRFDKDASPGDNLLSTDLGGDFEPGTGDFFIALVMKLPTSSGTQFIMTKAASGTQGLNLFLSGGNVLFRPGTHGSTTNNIQQNSVDNEFHIYVCRRTSSTITGHFDGAAFSTDNGSKVNDSSMNNDGEFRLGSSSTGGLDADMDLPEALIATGTLSDENRDKITGYLAWKYGLQANLPSDHTYRFHKPTIEPKRWQGGVNGVMTNALNWSGGSVPTARDKVLFDAEYRSNTITGSLTAGSVFVTPNFDGKIGTSESPATFTAESIVLGSDEADLNLQLASNTQTFVTSSTNGVKLTGTGTNIFLRSKSPTTLALSNDNTMTIDARHPSGAGGLVSHESGTPLLTRVGFGGALEHSFAGGLDTVEITGNGNYRHTVGSMPSFFLRGGEVVFDGETLAGVSDLLGGVFTLRDSSQPIVELGVIRVYPGGLLDLTGTATGQVDFGSSKVLTSQGGAKLRLGEGRSVAMS